MSEKALRHLNCRRISAASDENCRGSRAHSATIGKRARKETTMELRELLGEELFAQVDAKIQEHNSTITDKTKQVRYADLSEGNYVSREKYDSRVTELTGVRQQLTDANAAIQSYKDMDIDGIKKSASDWETKYTTDTAALNARIENLQKESAAKEFLSGKGFRSQLARKAALSGMMGLEFKDGKFSGADDYLKKLKEEDPDSFLPEDDPEARKKNNPANWVRGTSSGKHPGANSDQEAYLKAKYGNNKYYRGGSQ